MTHKMEEKMKRKAILTIALSGLLIFTACSGDDNTSSESSQSEVASQSDVTSLESEVTSVETSSEESVVEESSVAEVSESVDASDSSEITLTMEDLLNPTLPSLKDFTATTLDGDRFGSDQLAGKDLTLVNVWATTCGACIEEMPDLAKVEAGLPDNVQLVTLCLDGKENEEAARQILADSNFEGLTLVETSGDLSNAVAQVMYTPTTLLFDEEGNALGDQLIGVPQDVESAYTGIINLILETMGKDTI